MSNTWQLCPKCNGTGQSYSVNLTALTNVCDVCNGTKIISIFTGLPPRIAPTHDSNVQK